MSDSICSICMHDTSVENRCTLPGCGHSFHCACMINFVQYDVKCPVCRQIPTGVSVKDSNNSFEIAVEERLRIARLIWRRYSTKRRNFLQQAPHLQSAFSRLKTIRHDIQKKSSVLASSYEKKCKLLWKNDVDIAQQRKDIVSMRRKETRIFNKIYTEMESVIGPEPSTVIFL